MPAMKCQSCGSTDIENDSSRADAVCTRCGTVCESGMIVSDVQFEENAHGGSSALGRLIAVMTVVTVMILFNIVRNVRVVRQEGRQQFVCWRISQHQYWQRVPGGDSQERQEEDRGLGSAAPSEAGSH